MHHILWIDTETFSPTKISRGTDVYAQLVEIMIVAYAFDNGVVQLWDCTLDPIMPADLRAALDDPSYTIVAHNAFFDRTVMRYAWQFEVPLERWHCTMAQALAHSLPAGLALLCDVLGVKTRKQSGKDYINLFCMPRPKKQKLRRATRETHPQEWAAFMSYAADDVGAMRDAFYAMPSRNYKGDEKALWCLDQEINDYGFAVDLEFAQAAVDMLKADKERLDAEITSLTNGRVTAATQREKFMVELLMEYGVVLESLKADDLEELMLSDSIPTEVKELLRIRITSAMNSTAKFTRMMNCVSPDGRLRGTRQYNGASRTGRSAGRIFNPYNLRRPAMKAADIERCIQLVKDGDGEGVELFADNLREACSNALRGLLVAPPGKKLVISDWSNIEGRDAAWLTGETWKLDAFRAFDTKGPDGKRLGADLYKLTYSQAFAVLVALVTDFQRQIGKGMELSLQYGGGVGAFIAVSYAYGLDMEELARVIPTVAPWEIVAQARAIYQWALKKGKTLGLSEPVYVACETVKLLYRAANSHLAASWPALENAARSAMTYPGEEFPCCRCVFSFKNDWLMIRLPSGRHLMYPQPRIMGDDTITYGGSVNKQWRRIKTYGGKLLENITQASSRDILTHNMLRIKREVPEARIVLDVYDEVVCEVPETSGFGLADLNSMLTTNPAWSAGLPLAAEGFETRRYAKH